LRPIAPSMETDADALVPNETKTMKALAKERWRVLGEINNTLVSRYHPDHLVEWWREPNAQLDGLIPEAIASGDFDPDDSMVLRLLEVVHAKAEAAPRPILRGAHRASELP
jgi:hypothetical protein